MRISKFCGLTIQDIDLDRRTINIDHQLQRTSDMTQKAAQEVGWGIGQEEKTVKPLKSNVDKTRFLTHFRGRFINILSTLKSRICKEMPVYAGFQ